MADHIKITRAEGTWVVRAAGAVLGESSAALDLTEGDYPSVIYFPRDDLGMAFLEQTTHMTHCPHKGDATYFTIQTKSGPWENAAWSYETPKDAVARIKDHIAFYTDKVTVERL
ncbi:DUF427 domain-containing protein [Actibacterium sp. 188UL27-1]|uniref:DUF427 domain-containing protein n=1 Tax=Actibacterium sp. 188UL27-1 TaxID=2786961 RepID=UPI00195E67C4|nr:DUF427 domain-containing protein [Actibacterium sp. 188UL27-1]MBM7069304.1 DUF427 domain-containing protein [Actibacterium sp. 188UL27-1]